MNSAIRVVVADESSFVCRLLASHLQSVPDIQVVGAARTGTRAVELVAGLRPSVLTLGLYLKPLNGLETLRQIMRDCPTPVIMISGVSRRAAAVTLHALELGAVDFILKYTPGVDTDPDALRQEIVAKVRTASAIKVIRSLARGASLGRMDWKSALPRRDGLEIRPTGEVVVIGASTGGPVAVRDLLNHLPADFSAGIVVVQHLPAAFTGVLAAQLDRQGPLAVREARAGEQLRPGLVLVAPGDYHLLLSASGQVELNQGPNIGGHRPSIDVTMQSAAQAFGPRATGVLLTGMGEDGAQGLVSIHGRGGRTFAQDEETSVVYGMPQRAIDLGVVDIIASPAEIARLLQKDRHQADQAPGRIGFQAVTLQRGGRNTVVCTASEEVGR
jgi:two-component system chemotaxis response regulator CheB